MEGKRGNKYQAVEKVHLLRSRFLGAPHVPSKYVTRSSSPAASHLDLFEHPADETGFSTTR